MIDVNSLPLVWFTISLQGNCCHSLGTARSNDQVPQLKFVPAKRIDIDMALTLTWHWHWHWHGVIGPNSLTQKFVSAGAGWRSDHQAHSQNFHLVSPDKTQQRKSTNRNKQVKKRRIFRIQVSTEKMSTLNTPRAQYIEMKTLFPGRTWDGRGQGNVKRLKHIVCLSLAWWARNEDHGCIAAAFFGAQLLSWSQGI